MKRSLYAAAPAAVIGALLAPATSMAQTPGTLVPVAPCIRFLDASVKTFPLQGAGFAPGAAVTIASDGVPIDTATADAAGSFQGLFNAPPIAGTRANVSITADDGQGHPAGPLGLPEVKVSVVLARATRRRVSACCSAPTGSSAARPSISTSAAAARPAASSRSAGPTRRAG